LPVLVVDDNATNRRVLEGMLLQWQMRPSMAEDGFAAMTALEAAHERGAAFPLVLLDAHMPGMDGFDVAERIRQRPTLAGATILMLTSNDRTGDAARCRQIGATRYLVKPLAQRELLASIVEALGAQGHGPRAPQRTDSEAPVPGSAGLHLLLAEDNVVNQRLAAALLKRDGHVITIVGDGVAAVAAATTEHFDAVFMDVQMPEMSGYVATAAIRAHERTTGAHVRIIAMTAHAMKGDRERCLGAGMDDYVAKPIGLEALRRALDHVAAVVDPDGIQRRAAV
jgi:CheY-like chemotaxis protein